MSIIWGNRVMDEKVQPLISIIVPVYNVQSYLEECIQSIENQTIVNREVILIDDGSTDQSGVMCEKLSKIYDDIIVIHKENGGLGSARNAGLDIAKGKYIGFIDSDDYIAKDMYERLYDAMIKNKCEIACCNRYRLIRKEGMNQITEYKSNGIQTLTCMKNENAIKYLLLDRGITYSACDKLFERNLFDGIRFPNNKYPSEDIPCIFKIVAKSNRIAHIGVPKYYYRLNEQSITHQEFKTENISTFHYMSEIYQDILQSFCLLKEEALYAYMQSTAAIYSRMINDGKCKEFKEIEKELRRTIKSYLGKILMNQYFSANAKIVMTMISIRIYPFFSEIINKRAGKEKNAE